MNVLAGWTHPSAVNRLSSQLTARLNWLFSQALVREGLPDAWRIRINDRSVEGVFSLEDLPKVQSEHPDTRVRIRHAEHSFDSASAAWLPVITSAQALRFLQFLFLIICGAAGCYVAAHIFKGNEGNTATRILLAAIVGVASSLYFRAALQYLVGRFVWLLHLFGEHTKAFFSGAALGGTCGIFAGLYLWDFAAGVPAGLAIASLMGLAGGLLTAAALGQAHHERCVERRGGNHASVPVSPAPILLPQIDRFWTSAFKSRPLIVAVFVTLLTAQIPRHVTGTDSDASFSSVLNYAHQKNWQFGSDIVYTYGPLGFLTSHHYSTVAPRWQMATKTALAFVVALGACLVAWRLPLLWKWLLIGVFIFFSGAIQMPGNPYAATDFSMYAGLLCWAAFSAVESLPRLAACCLVLVALAVLGTLVKISFIVPSVLGVATIACGLALRGHRRLGFMMPIAYGVGVILCWLGAGQHLSNLGLFLTRGFEVSRGYHDAMCFQIKSVVSTSIAAGLVALSTLVYPLLVALGVFGGKIVWHRLLSWAWFCCLFFALWKYGMIQSGQAHLQVYTGFLAILSLVMLVPAEPDGKPVPWARALSLIALFMSVVLLDTTFYRGFTSFHFLEPFNLLPWNVQCLLKPTDYFSVKTTYPPLPRTRALVGQATVDVFGNAQANAILNGLNYHPRPVFQSMVAYNAALIEMNERFYFCKDAPEFVLLLLEPIYGNLPALADSMVLRDILINYNLVETEEPFLILKSRGRATPQLALVRDGRARPGEEISIPSEGDAALWMEIEMEPSLAGKIRRFFYKSPLTVLWVWPDANRERFGKFRAPWPMLSAGFVASPLILGNQDVKDLYAGSRVVRPTAYAIKIPSGTERFWKETFRFRIYKIRNRFGQSTPSSVQSE
jgi:hypothetical protein